MNDSFSTDIEGIISNETSPRSKGLSSSFSQRRNSSASSAVSGSVKSGSAKSGSAMSEALDYFADICEEIDDIFVKMSPSSQVEPTRNFFPPKASNESAATKVKSPSNGGTKGNGVIQYPISLKLLRFGDGIASIVPETPSDMDRLLALENGKTTMTISLEKVDMTTHPSPRPPASVTEPLDAEASLSAPAPDLINPKHIYSTSCDTFRIQISKGSKLNPNGKFSRNARSEVDAFWLCECALMLVDRPTSLQDMLVNGNYKCLLQRGFVISPEDYEYQLRRKVIDLHARKLLKLTEYEKIVATLEMLSLPPLKVCSVSEPDERVANNDDDIDNKRNSPLFGWGSMLSSSWKSITDSDRKKRRRVPKHALSPGSQTHEQFFTPNDSRNHLPVTEGTVGLHNLTSDFVKHKRSERKK